MGLYYRVMQPYSAEIEEQMKRYYRSLSEKDRRRYAAIEAIKLGHGGINYISKLFGCHYQTITLGKTELLDEEALKQQGIRRAGAGRKSAFESLPGLDDAFLKVMEAHTAGSPMNERVKWSYLSRQEIADAVTAAGYPISVTVVDQLLKKHNFRKRQAQKKLAGGTSEQRDEQFKTIARLKAGYQAAGNPVISMDSKKKK